MITGACKSRRRGRSGAEPAGGRAAGERRSIWKSARWDPRSARIRLKKECTSGIAGVIAVVLVMLVYYKRSGINATLALILNAMILIAALSYFDAVLTLPGIAGSF